MFLNKAADKEIGFYQRFVSDLAVNYGTSEIYFNHGQGGILNSALIAVGFREGSPSNYCVYRPLIQDNESQRHNVIPLATRMAAFLDAMTNELIQSNKDLKNMAEQAKTANQAKSDFLSNMSHEIRTPINAILGMDEMILREATDDTIRGYAENIRTAGTTLLGLVNDILDFSKIEAGKLELIPAEYATSSILNDLVNMITNRAKNKAAISDVELKEAWETIGDIIQTVDYDNLIYLLGELAGYKLEEKDRQKLQLLQEAAQVPDWERLKELIK